jgi:hypothetical protein
MIWQIIVTLFTFTWFLAVVKVFLLGDKLSHRHHHDPRDPETLMRTVPGHSADAQDGPRGSSRRFRQVFDKTYQAPESTQLSTPVNPVKKLTEIPRHTDWDIIREEPDGFERLRQDAGSIIPAEELSWPPVNMVGTIPANEGFDSMPLTGIKVPRFWHPPSTESIFETGRFVDGQETIFLMIASYRDFQCRETITSAYKRADHPERLFIGT